ncbi:interleukin-6 [Ornithorhynchus anatinus]|uniref:Interleukin-6 n=1 Tax=Ornithorhynchus anatinus TaxID=9258 RepID=F6YS54_ORNAN|nr:interleukin-6 [Ornithorhynchus anatinus]
MNSLLQSTAALILLLIMTATALPTSKSSKEELSDVALPNKSPSSKQPFGNPESLTKTLWKQANGLKDKICDDYSLCEENKVVLAENNMNLPKMTEEDGCFLSGFNEETCLKRIITGLSEFQIYLKYVQKTFKGEEKILESIQNYTKHLSNILKQMMKTSDAGTEPSPMSQESLLTKLQSLEKWTKTISMQLIISNFTKFIEDTMRAVRFMKTRSLNA